MPFPKRLTQDPFWLLIACILTTQEPWRKAEKYHRRIKLKWPTPTGLSRAYRPDLVAALEGLSFNEQKASQIREAAGIWHTVVEGTNVRLTSQQIAEMPGCGTFVVEAWRIFIERDLDFEPSDARLRGYGCERSGQP